jgi:hypothetical protein
VRQAGEQAPLVVQYLGVLDGGGLGSEQPVIAVRGLNRQQAAQRDIDERDGDVSDGDPAKQEDAHLARPQPDGCHRKICHRRFS